jgi:hypothetical protein
MSPMGYTHWWPWQILTRRAGLLLVHRFDTTFDVERLKAELAAVRKEYDIVPHYRGSYMAGEEAWGAITLVGADGDPKDHRPQQTFQGRAIEYIKTPALRLAPYMESIIDGFGAKTRRVRLMQLAAGTRIFWHDDGDEYGIDNRTVRLHIPIVTNDRVEVQVSHQDCRWREGELWFLDNSFTHRLRNRGTEARVHLVIDLQVDDHVRAMFPQAHHDQESQRQKLRPACRRWYALTAQRWLKLERERQRRRGTHGLAVQVPQGNVGAAAAPSPSPASSRVHVESGASRGVPVTVDSEV